MARISSLSFQLSAILLIFMSIPVFECRPKLRRWENEVIKGREEQEEEDFPCLCNLSIHPICGTDGITYPNHCVAECKHVEVAHTGTCLNKDQLLDTRAWRPILHNETPRQRAWRPILDMSRRACECDFHWDPVCTAHGSTYNNACWAECVGAEYYEGECQ